MLPCARRLPHTSNRCRRSHRCFPSSRRRRFSVLKRMDDARERWPAKCCTLNGCWTHNMSRRRPGKQGLQKRKVLFARTATPGFPSAEPHGHAHSQALPAVGSRHGLVHGATRFHDREHGHPGHGRELAGGTAQPQGGRHQLHPEPGRLHSGKRLDGRPLRHAACIRDCSGTVHPFFDSLRLVNKRPDAGRRTHASGRRCGDDDARRQARDHPHIPEVRAADGDELRHHPGADRPAARSDGRRPDRALAVVAGNILRQHAGGPGGAVSHSSLHAGLPRRIHATSGPGRDWSCSAAARRFCRGCWRFSASITSMRPRRPFCL